MEDVTPNIDLAAAIALGGVLASALVALPAPGDARDGEGHERLAREAGLPLLGKVPMEAVYAAIFPVGRVLARIGVSANAVSIASLAIAAAAGTLFGMGHFGAGAVVAVVATLADALDGIVARETRTTGRFGQVLDTTIDRYVDALLFGGIAVFVRAEVWLLVLTIAALVGGFMVSYASSVLRELKADDTGAPMRRVHRVAYLLSGAALVPFAQAALPRAPLGVRLGPLVLALGAIALIGNVSAVLRLLRTARAPEAASAPVPATKLGLDAAPTDRASARIDPVVTRERHP